MTKALPVYEVTIQFGDRSIRNEYMQWLKTSHIPDVLTFPGFLSAEVSVTVYPADVESIVIRYSLTSADVYHRYDVSPDARRIRRDAVVRFGDKAFASMKRILVNTETIKR